jgi:amidophosphoribosyltransferase
VFFCSASPAIRYPNVYGIDMPVQAELIAFNRDEEEIAAAIGADWVVYQVKGVVTDLLMNMLQE